MNMSKLQMPSQATAKAVLSVAASLAASAVVLRTVVNELIPRELRDHIFSTASTFLAGFSSTFSIVVQEFHGMLPNEMFKAADTYLATKISPSTRCIQVAKMEDSKAIEVTIERGETVVDFFQGVEFRSPLEAHNFF